MNMNDIEFELSLEKELRILAQKGMLGICSCEGDHYLAINDLGQIQCRDCLALYMDNQAIIDDLKYNHGPLRLEEFIRLKKIQRKVLNEVSKEEPTIYMFVTPDGRIRRRYFYE
jgi:hypothetical protein